MPTFTRGIRDGEVTSAKIANDSIVNADIKSDAAIEQSKLATLSITESLLTLADNTTANVSASAHGLCPKIPNNTTTFLRGDGTFAAPASGTRANILFIDTATTASAVEHTLFTKAISAADLATDNQLKITLYTTAGGSLAYVAKCQIDDGTNIFTSADASTGATTSLRVEKIVWILTQESTTTLRCKSFVMFETETGTSTPKENNETATMITNWLAAAFTINIRINDGANNYLYAVEVERV